MLGLVGELGLGSDECGEKKGKGSGGLVDDG